MHFRSRWPERPAKVYLLSAAKIPLSWPGEAIGIGITNIKWMPTQRTSRDMSHKLSPCQLEKVYDGIDVRYWNSKSIIHFKGSILQSFTWHSGTDSNKPATEWRILGREALLRIPPGHTFLHPIIHDNDLDFLAQNKDKIHGKWMS